MASTEETVQGLQQADQEANANYKANVHSLNALQIAVVLVHLLITTLLFIMAFVMPEGTSVSGSRVGLAIIALVTFLFASYRAYDVWIVNSKTKQDVLPSYTWHNAGFNYATINAFTTSLAMWPAVFLFIFHQSNLDWIKIFQSSYDPLLGGSKLLFGAVVLLFFTFFVIIGVYVYSYRYVGQMLVKYQAEEQKDPDFEGLEMCGKDKVILFVTLMSNFLLTVALIILAVEARNSAVWAGAIVQLIVWLVFVVVGWQIKKRRRIREDTILGYRNMLILHLWLNNLIFWTSMMVTLLIRIGKYDGFFSALSQIGTFAQGLVWGDLIGFGIILLIYVSIHRQHQTGMWQADELENHKLMMDMVATSNPSDTDPL